MPVVKWAAVALTLLMGLANLGQVAQDSTVGWKVLGVALAVTALIAVVAFIVGANWGAAAVITVGVVNLAAAIVAAITGLDGWPVAVVLSTLAVVLVALYTPPTHTTVTA